MPSKRRSISRLLTPKPLGKTELKNAVEKGKQLTVEEVHPCNSSIYTLSISNLSTATCTGTDDVIVLFKKFVIYFGTSVENIAAMTDKPPKPRLLKYTILKLEELASWTALLIVSNMSELIPGTLLSAVSVPFVIEV